MLTQEHAGRLKLAQQGHHKAMDKAEAERLWLVAWMKAAREAGATNQEIGDVLGVTRQRVSQILRKDSK